MDEASREKLWQDYITTRDAQYRDKLIVEYAQLVKIVAGRMSMYLGYNVEYDDLVGYGIFGLIDAIDKFDYGKNVKFETYASLRIRGAILDQIRKMDWIPRSLRQKQRRIDQAMSKIEADTGKTATDEQIAKELGITMDELSSWQGQAKLSNMVSLDEFTEEGTETAKMEAVGNARFEHPEDVVEKEELKKMIVEALDSLTEKEREVVVLYYYEDMTLKEISLVLEVSESRVSQLHTKALNKMRLKLGDYMGILE
jgi:RNA polymerase sigma factor for flagellar operon FliA